MNLEHLMVPIISIRLKDWQC